MTLLIRFILALSVLLHPAAAISHWQTVCEQEATSCCCGEAVSVCPCCPGEPPATPAPETKTSKLDPVLPEPFFLTATPVPSRMAIVRSLGMPALDSAPSVQSRLCIWLT